MKQVENAFRGTNFLMPGVIYMKLKIYFEGLRENALFFLQHSENLDQALDQALIGKMDHTSPEEMKAVRQLLLSHHTSPCNTVA